MFLFSAICRQKNPERRANEVVLISMLVTVVVLVVRCVVKRRQGNGNVNENPVVKVKRGKVGAREEAKMMIAVDPEVIDPELRRAEKLELARNHVNPRQRSQEIIRDFYQRKQYLQVSLRVMVVLKLPVAMRQVRVRVGVGLDLNPKDHVHQDHARGLNQDQEVVQRAVDHAQDREARDRRRAQEKVVLVHVPGLHRVHVLLVRDRKKVIHDRDPDQDRPVDPEEVHLDLSQGQDHARDHKVVRNLAHKVVPNHVHVHVHVHDQDRDPGVRVTRDPDHGPEDHVVDLLVLAVQQGNVI